MPEVPAVSGTPGLKRAVDAAFADDGPLARAVDQFEPRAGQRAMAGAVADTLEHGGVLLAEAGTGTGKTLAYLVPAILSRQRVLISTGTKNLQEQIYFKDIPALRTALGVPFTATYMKGRANYLCLHRLDQLRAHPAAPMDFISTIDEWRRATDTGDRAELERPRGGLVALARRLGARRRPASATTARSIASATSRGCGSAPPNPTW